MNTPYISRLTQEEEEEEEWLWAVAFLKQRLKTHVLKKSDQHEHVSVAVQIQPLLKASLHLQFSDLEQHSGPEMSNGFVLLQKHIRWQVPGSGPGFITA